MNEFSVINQYFSSLTPFGEAVVLGPGDDCAVLTVPAGKEMCVSTDTLLEGVHFPTGVSADVVATRCFQANLSDLAAMAAEPLGFVLAMSLPDINHDWLKLFSETLKAQSESAQMPLVGGNLSKGSLSLTMTVMGAVPQGGAVARAGARVGHGIYVTGTLGDAARGLQLYQSGCIDGDLPERYVSPTARIRAGIALREIATAMIDVSDGFLADLNHLLSASQVGAHIELPCLPISKALLEDSKTKAVQFALNGGDDYELCFTAADDVAVDALSHSLDLRMTRIGQVVDGEGVTLFDEAGEISPLPTGGYEHF